ncbi:putative 3-phosphoinositide-dependent protein kinase 1 [Blattamonas nauphoetae]|uniref:non-specific serine/threonine protein kinase n=1 Tax=Blattamonas nauphoetae TaxID=2049346 RepID=A0ABQ9Y4T3_9EUKA|nr:putative 3-phosphoinositide-dependent protein kinase 1 [Blattamonas nauphoetae]
MIVKLGVVYRDRPLSERDVDKGWKLNSKTNHLKLEKFSPTDFNFEETIGFGSFSSVIKAVNKKTGKLVAIKQISKSHIIKNKMEKTVYTERDVLRKYPHPLILHFYGNYQDNESLYFVLELCKTDMSKYVSQKALHIEVARFFTAELLQALEHLHTNGVVHRDLKPENIFLATDGHIRVADFGSALIRGSEQEKEEMGNKKGREMVGTPLYVSPEVIKNEMATEQSDLWAFGLILFYLIAGHPLFSGATQFLLFNHILKANYTIPPGFDETAADLVRKLVVLNPSDRLTINQIKQHPFFTTSTIPWDTIHLTNPPIHTQTSSSKRVANNRIHIAESNHETDSKSSRSLARTPSQFSPRNSEMDISKPHQQSHSRLDHLSNHSIRPNVGPHSTTHNFGSIWKEELSPRTQTSPELSTSEESGENLLFSLTGRILPKNNFFPIPPEAKLRLKGKPPESRISPNSADSSTTPQPDFEFSRPRPSTHSQPPIPSLTTPTQHRTSSPTSDLKGPLMSPYQNSPPRQSYDPFVQKAEHPLLALSTMANRESLYDSQSTPTDPRRKSTLDVEQLISMLETVKPMERSQTLKSSTQVEPTMDGSQSAAVTLEPAISLPFLLSTPSIKVLPAAKQKLQFQKQRDVPGGPQSLVESEAMSLEEDLPDTARQDGFVPVWESTENDAEEVPPPKKPQTLILETGMHRDSCASSRYDVPHSPMVFHQTASAFEIRVEPQPEKTPPAHQPASSSHLATADMKNSWTSTETASEEGSIVSHHSTQKRHHANVTLQLPTISSVTNLEPTAPHIFSFENSFPASPVDRDSLDTSSSSLDDVLIGESIAQLMPSNTVATIETAAYDEDEAKKRLNDAIIYERLLHNQRLMSSPQQSFSRLSSHRHRRTLSDSTFSSMTSHSLDLEEPMKVEASVHSLPRRLTWSGSVTPRGGTENETGSGLETSIERKNSTRGSPSSGLESSRENQDSDLDDGEMTAVKEEWNQIETEISESDDESLRSLFSVSSLWTGGQGEVIPKPNKRKAAERRLDVLLDTPWNDLYSSLASILHLNSHAYPDNGSVNTMNDPIEEEENEDDHRDDEKLSQATSNNSFRDLDMSLVANTLHYSHTPPKFTTLQNTPLISRSLQNTSKCVTNTSSTANSPKSSKKSCLLRLDTIPPAVDQTFSPSSFLMSNERTIRTSIVWLWAKKQKKTRHLILTDTPRLLFVNPMTLTVTGEVIWGAKVWAEAADATRFSIHTKQRILLLDDVRQHKAVDWVEDINRQTVVFKQNLSATIPLPASSQQSPLASIRLD